MFAREHKGGPDGMFYTLAHLSESWDLDALAASMGAERLLFASGGGDLFERALGVVERSSISAEARDAVLLGNAGGLWR